MNAAADSNAGPDASAGLAPLRMKSGWVVALGVLYLITGVLALGSVITATVATVFFVGIMMIVAGVGEVFGAFQIRGWGRFLLWVLVGLLYIIAGIATFQNPLLAAVVLTFVLGFALVASGLTRIVLAFGVKQMGSWILVGLSGVVTVILGLMVLARWPVSSIYILGIFLGVDLIVAGIGWIGLGLGLRKARA